MRETLFVRNALSFIAPKTSGSTIEVLEDNEGAVALIQNPPSSGHNTHIECALPPHSGVIQIEAYLGRTLQDGGTAHRRSHEGAESEFFSAPLEGVDEFA